LARAANTGERATQVTLINNRKAPNGMAWQQERLTLFAELLGHVHAHERAANLRGQRYNLQRRSQSHARGKASSLQKQKSSMKVMQLTLEGAAK
jgi:hypothetical protein